MELSLDESVKAIDGKIVINKENLIFNEVCTDTRKIEKDNLFIGLKGAGIIVSSPSTLVSMGSLCSAPALLSAN